MPEEVQSAVGGIFRDAEIKHRVRIARAEQQFALTRGGRVVQPHPALAGGDAGLGLAQEVIGAGQHLGAIAEAQVAQPPLAG